MPETEIKILGVELEEVAQRLENLGAEKLFEGIVKCVHFDLPGQPIRMSKSLYRLRRWKASEGFESRNEVCYKGAKQIVDGCKVREEIEVAVDDADLFQTMMETLGYQITLDNEKRRRSYEWEGAHFDLDEYPEAPGYMEIEGTDRTAIDRAIEAIQLKEFEHFEESTETANELFARLWPGLDFDHLKF